MHPSLNPTAIDVAEYILSRYGEMDALKLQKLVYYSQAWSLVWHDRPLFDGRIEAWRFGPVATDLWQQHQGQRKAVTVGGRPEHVDTEGRGTIDEVLRHYGDASGTELSDLTHREDPWRDARRGLDANAGGNEEITPAAMRSFYAHRPCGPVEMFSDVSAFDAERIRIARAQLDAEDFITPADL